MITEIECVYEGHFSFKVEDLDVEWSRVVDWNVKYGTLHYTLDDGTDGELDVGAEQAYDNLDTKWPARTMVCYNGVWMTRQEANAKETEEEE
jgi:hypothetical protein